MTLLLSIIFVFLLLLFIITVKVAFIFNTDKNMMQLSMTWLYPFIKGTVEMNASKPLVKVYCLKKLLYKKSLKMKQKEQKKKNWLAITKPEDVSVKASYGLNDPFSTGILSGVFGGALEWFKNVSYDLKPDFVPSQEYVDILVTAKINLGKSLLRATKLLKA